MESLIAKLWNRRQQLQYVLINFSKSWEANIVPPQVWLSTWHKTTCLVVEVAKKRLCKAIVSKLRINRLDMFRRMIRIMAILQKVLRMRG